MRVATPPQLGPGGNAPLMKAQRLEQSDVLQHRLAAQPKVLPVRARHQEVNQRSHRVLLARFRGGH